MPKAARARSCQVQMFADRSGPGDFLVGEAGKSFQFSCWILQPIGIAKLGYPLFLSHVL